MKKKKLNKPNVYCRGIAAFYIANRNVATTHLNNQSGTIATVQNLNLKKEKEKRKRKKRLNKPNVYCRGIAAFYIANRNVATTLALRIYTFVMKVL